MRAVFGPQVALKAFLDRLADIDLVEILNVRKAFKKENTLDQLIGVFHLVD